jgi:hypothetical protein
MRRALLLAAPLLALASSGVAGALSGDAPRALGWWSQDPTAAEQPGGGFQVAAAGGQAVSIAALRFDVPDGALNGTLSLQEAEGGVVSPATALQVCTTADPWEPANPGPWADAPAPDCETPIELTRDEASLTWSASVPADAAGSLVVVPGETAGGGSPVDPGFQVTFTGAALEVVAPSGSGGSAVPTPPPSTFTPPPSSGGGSSPSFAGGGSGSSFSAPGPVTPTTTATTVAGGDTTVTTVAVAEGEAFEQVGDGSGGGGGADQPWERLLLLVPMSALAGVAFVYGKRVLRQRGVLEEA